jgi:hypothetical protein
MDELILELRHLQSLNLPAIYSDVHVKRAVELCVKALKYDKDLTLSLIEEFLPVGSTVRSSLILTLGPHLENLEVLKVLNPRAHTVLKLFDIDDDVKFNFDLDDLYRFADPTSIQTITKSWSYLMGFIRAYDPLTDKTNWSIGWWDLEPFAGLSCLCVASILARNLEGDVEDSTFFIELIKPVFFRQYTLYSGLPYNSSTEQVYFKHLMDKWINR